jgi:sorbitol-6-phosphate 2-dehydrogenase
MNLPLENKIAVVTGGAQGLGQAICGALAKAGCHLAIADIKDEAAQAMVKEIVRATGRKAFALKTDVTQEVDVQQLFVRAVSEFGRVDIVVANAAILIAEPIAEADAEKWRAVMNVNLFGNFLTMKHACRVMKPQASGVIIQINSKSGKKGSAANSAYAATKFGGIGLVQSVALRWRRTASAATPSAPATCSIRRFGPIRTTACSSSISRPAKCPARKPLKTCGSFTSTKCP